jgi:hypothetical protein
MLSRKTLFAWVWSGLFIAGTFSCASKESGTNPIEEKVGDFEGSNLKLEGGTPGVAPTREDPVVKARFRGQSLSSARDTVYADLSCTESKDIIFNVALVETSVKSGIYESALIPKREGSAVADPFLQCLSLDNVKLKYRDPVYQDVQETLVPL